MFPPGYFDGKRLCTLQSTHRLPLCCTSIAILPSLCNCDCLVFFWQKGVGDLWNGRIIWAELSDMAAEKQFTWHQSAMAWINQSVCQESQEFVWSHFRKTWQSTKSKNAKYISLHSKKIYLNVSSCQRVKKMQVSPVPIPEDATIRGKHMQFLQTAPIFYTQSNAPSKFTSGANSHSWNKPFPCLERWKLCICSAK